MRNAINFLNFHNVVINTSGISYFEIKLDKMSQRIDEFTFTWKIDNFLLCDKTNGVELDSPTFVIDSFNQSKWYLCIYPKGQKEKDKDYLSIYLHNVHLNTRNIALYYKFEFIRIDGMILESKEFKYVFKKEGSWGCPQFSSVAKIQNNMTSSTDTLTILCYMKRLDNSYPTQCEALTKILADRHTILWNILYRDSSEWTEIRTFCFAESSPVEVVLTNSDDNILISIRRINKQIFSPGVIRCKIFLLKVEGIEYDSKEDSHFFSKMGDIWEFPSFLTKSELNAKKEILFKEDIFVLQFEFSCSNGRYLDEIVKYDILDITEVIKNSSKSTSYSLDFDSLRDDFIKLCNNKHHSDIELKVAGTAFHAHKTVLVARSKVFSTKLDHNMSESQTGVVEIEDIDGETFKHFFNFLYTDRIEEMEYEAALKLLRAANKYEVLSLVEKCVSFLISSFTNENVCEILLVADMVEHKTLKSAAINFIKKNSKHIISTLKWLKWIGSNFDLAKEVFSELSVE